ncbi:MAG: M28 family peptidase, partial [Urechidicola sp.]|nr:M28 family peptidase [Urechidicola sp.]
LIVLLLVSCNDSTHIIEENTVKNHLYTLADDAMEGRKAGTEGADKAAQYIESEFKRIGLEFFSDATSYRQNFEYKGLDLFNVIGYLPGKSKKEELVIISAHYDHLGIESGVEGDSIFNGANDNASGVAAVLTLAEYFKEENKNERSILFVGFTAEEMGIVGSNYFGTTIDPEKIVTGINIEMIGKESSYGPQTAWLTGFDRSDFGTMVQKNVENTGYTIHPDPYYPDFNLFFRSDNAALAFLGVPAHTFSTSPPDDKDYHKVSDEAETLNIENITETIRVIAIGTSSFIDGTDTPTRIQISDEEKKQFEKMLERVR